MYCLAARDLTTACMVSTLCEPKVFQVAKWCQENADPNSVRFIASIVTN